MTEDVIVGRLNAAKDISYSVEFPWDMFQGEIIFLKS
jgi:hypothetical protein